MSLSRIVLRMLAVKALTGATLAGDRVSDSAIDPVDVSVTETHLPLLTVVTDDDLFTGKGRDFGADERQLDLVIEIAVASEVKEGEITIPHTDFGLEWSIDIMEHQIDKALFGGGSAASQAFMNMIPRVHRKASRRGSSAEKGIRYAARQIVYTIEPISDPPLGVKLTDKVAFGSAIAFIEADQDTAEIGQALRSMIENPSLSPIAASIANAAMTQQGAEAIRVADLGDGAILEEGTIIDGEGNVLAHDVIRAAKADVKGGSTASATAIKV